MNSLLFLIIQIISLYKIVLIIYIIATWLINFNIINTSNRFVYSIMEALYKLSEPSLKIVRRYIPNFGSIDMIPKENENLSKLSLKTGKIHLVYIGAIDQEHPSITRYLIPQIKDLSKQGFMIDIYPSKNGDYDKYNNLDKLIFV